VDTGSACAHDEWEEASVVDECRSFLPDNKKELPPLLFVGQCITGIMFVVVLQELSLMHNISSLFVMLFFRLEAPAPCPCTLALLFLFVMLYVCCHYRYLFFICFVKTGCGMQHAASM
jgi:hypothetical protein